MLPLARSNGTEVLSIVEITVMLLGGTNKVTSPIVTVQSFKESKSIPNICF